MSGIIGWRKRQFPSPEIANIFCRSVSHIQKFTIFNKIEKMKPITGQGILIPAHASSHVKPNGRFKLLLTVIKSGYEE